MAGGFIKKIRVFVWLYILFLVAGTAWLTKARSTDWDRPLDIVIYPINGDKSETTSKYIKSLDRETFEPIDLFFQNEAKRYKLSLKDPVDIHLSKEIKEIPPKLPRTRSTLSIMFWSLKLRYWSWSRDNYDYPKEIQIFVVYFDPEKTSRVAHSLGLQKGLIGVVNAFSSKRMTSDNNVIITHEILHTVGANDKYDPKTNMPFYPIGYAEPERNPVWPQKKAEIMGGRIPINETKAVSPQKMKQTVIGEETAKEIRWITET